MNTDQRLRDSRVTEALERLRRRLAAPRAWLLLSALGVAVAYALMAWSDVMEPGTRAWTIPTLIGALLVGVAALVPATRAAGVRPPDGTPDDSRSQRRRRLAGLVIPIGIFLPTFVTFQAGLARSLPSVALIAALYTVLLYIAFRWLTDASGGVDVPAGVADDPRVADPEVAALVAVLHDTVEVRSDVVAEALDVDRARLAEVIDAAADAGLVRARDALRRTVNARDRRSTPPRELWLCLSEEGRTLLVTAAVTSQK